MRQLFEVDMHRHFFAFLNIFLCFCIHANAQNKLVLEKVTIDTAYSTQPIMLQWSFDSKFDSISIASCTEECYEERYQTKDTVLMDKENLTWRYYDVDTKSSQIHFTIFNNNYGGGQTDPQNNIVLDAQIVSGRCANSATLSWNPYINMMDSLDFYNIYKKKSDEEFKLDTSIAGKHYKYSFPPIGGTFPTEKIRYEVTGLTPNTEYEFIIEAVNKTGTIRVNSNIARVATSDLDVTPDTINIKRIRVINDNTAIVVDVKIDKIHDPDNFLQLNLLRGVDENNITDTIESNNTGVNTYSFEDKKDIDPNSKLYYYMAVAEQKCKANNTSNILTNILLVGERMAIAPPQDSIVFYQKGDTLPESYKLLLNGYVNDRELILEQVEYFNVEDASMNEYRIISSKEDTSNILRIIPPEIYFEFPNAFYPQSNSDMNKTFYPIFEARPAKEGYSFFIYNRWGQEVFRSNTPPECKKCDEIVCNDCENYETRWNGKFQGKDCPVGIYAYKLSFVNKIGKRKTVSGSFMLVR